ncbi:phenylalanine--tRNA ligase subunit beta [Candidatus Woesearchaeota archaeon]|nr:phenylalanine--tRNA ligase subunit beta [Candidatus Woesearchaeota archaeon]
MPTVNLSKKVLEKLVGKKLSLDMLKDRISMLGTDLEHIKDDEIKVEVFPNRPDMLSEQGFARAFSSFIGVKTGLREYKVKKSGHHIIVDNSVTMRPYTACAIVKNLTMTDERIREIMQMQEKLATTHGRGRKKSCYGIYPVDKVHFPITYTAKDPATLSFTPLGFDQKIKASEIVETHPTGPKYAHISQDWKKYPFYIDAHHNVMSMLPFTNSNDTGRVELDTKNIFIECTGTEQHNVELALHMFCAMFSDMGGDIYSLEIRYPDNTLTTPRMDATPMDFDLKYINRILGLSLSEKEATTLLKKMGYGYKKGKVLVPAYRADILGQIDFAEDIAIAYGYEHFTEELPQVATIGKESPQAILERTIAHVLTGLGMLELQTYHLSNTALQTSDMSVNTTKTNQDAKKKTKSAVIELANSVSEDYHCLRSWMLPGLIEVLSHNKHHEYPQKLFDMGKVFKKGKTETGVEEDTHLGLIISHDKADYTDIRQVIDYLTTALNKEITIEETTHPSFVPGRCAQGIHKGKVIATFGELHPEILARFKLELPVAAGEIDLSAFQTISQ